MDGKGEGISHVFFLDTRKCMHTYVHTHRHRHVALQISHFTN